MPPLRMAAPPVDDAYACGAESQGAGLAEPRSGGRWLSREDAVLRSFFDGSSDLVHFADLDSRISYANPTWCHALGYTADEALGLTIFDVLRPEDREAVRAIRRGLAHDRDGKLK